MSDHDEYERLAKEANAKKHGSKSGRKQTPPVRSNRVTTEYLNPIRDIAIDRFTLAMKGYEGLLDDALALVADKDAPDKDKAARIRTAKEMAQLLKIMAQQGSGCIHPTGSNTVVEKNFAAERVQAARAKFRQKEEEAEAALKKLSNQPKDE